MKDYTKLLDEWAYKNPSTLHRPYNLVSTVDDALQEAIKYNDIRPLTTFLEKFPEELSANREACEFLSKKLQGEVIQGTGKRGAYAKYKKIRDFQILKWVYFFKGYGLNVYDCTMQDAISISIHIIKCMGLSPVSYETAIGVWKKHARSHRLPWEENQSKGERNLIFCLSYDRGLRQRLADKAANSYENYVKKLKNLQQ